MFGPWDFKTLPVVPPLHLQEAALKTQRVSTPDTKYEEDPFEAADLQTAYLLWSTPYKLTDHGRTNDPAYCNATP